MRQGSVKHPDRFLDQLRCRFVVLVAVLQMRTKQLARREVANFGGDPLGGILKTILTNAWNFPIL